MTKDTVEKFLRGNRIIAFHTADAEVAVRALSVINNSYEPKFILSCVRNRGESGYNIQYALPPEHLSTLLTFVISTDRRGEYECEAIIEQVHHEMCRVKDICDAVEQVILSMRKQPINQ